MPRGLVDLNQLAAHPSNGTLEGWLFFRLDDALIGDVSVKNYEVTHVTIKRQTKGCYRVRA